jgi:hypothetical protein
VRSPWHCPGAGRCHGPRDWCARCDASKLGPCDARARGERCDAHPPAAEIREELARLEVDCAGAVEDVLAAEVEVRRARAALDAAVRRAEARRLVAGRLGREAAEVGRRLAAAEADEGRAAEPPGEGERA